MAVGSRVGNDGFLSGSRRLTSVGCGVGMYGFRLDPQLPVRETDNKRGVITLSQSKV